MPSSATRARSGDRAASHFSSPVKASLLAVSAYLVCLLAGSASAQEMPGHEGMSMPMGPPFMFGAQAILELSRVSPAHSGNTYTEGYVTQPALMAAVRAFDGALRGTGTLDVEGLTLRRGELTPGAWGEGYVDRRHPHTYIHEIVASGVLERARVGASLSAGKGFAPFGTDDPMVRPFVKYPSNHHLSQILERAVVIGAARAGPLILEAGTFSGDEPRRPSDFADVSHLGDSWAARATLRPLAALELEASRAFVRSPERPDRQGLDQRKWSASARWGGQDRRAPYALLEWATTRESGPGAPGFRFSSVLGEGSTAAGPLLLALRYERSTRPEEERLANPFRSPRPSPDFSIISVTRWESITAHARWLGAVRGGILRPEPFVEAMLSRPSDARPGPLFSARDFYGATRIWTLSAGVRLEAGMVHGRMGRYGIAAE